VFTTEHSPGCDRGAHNLFASGQHALHHTRFALVEHQQRVQIAITGVKDIQYLQLMTLRDLVDLTQHLRQHAPRHDGVVQVVVGLDARDGAEG